MAIPNIYYIVRNDKSNKNDIGFFKKFYGQISVFRKTGNVFFIYFHGKDIITEIFNFNTEEEPEIIITKSYKSKFKAHFCFYSVIAGEIIKTGIDVFYFRYKISEPLFLMFLSKLKRNFPSIRIFSEFPTFPYDKNWKQESPLKKVLLPVDRFFRKYLKRYIDFAVTYYDADMIFGIKTLRISNAVDVHAIPLKRENKKTDEFILIGVAGLGFWHGYDRVIKGIYEYNKNNPVIKAFFYIVGDGKEKAKLKELSKTFSLEEHVIFFGPLTGEKLDELFDQSHIAVNTIGWHRMGVTGNDTLKAREYCARGIPFITSGHDVDFWDDFKYKIAVEEDESPVDISMVIDFYHGISGADYSNEMRELAYKKMSWDFQLSKVISKFNGN